jgi:hypothetical protein
MSNKYSENPSLDHGEALLESHNQLVSLIARLEAELKTDAILSAAEYEAKHRETREQSRQYIQEQQEELWRIDSKS